MKSTSETSSSNSELKRKEQAVNVQEIFASLNDFMQHITKNLSYTRVKSRKKRLKKQSTHKKA